MSEQTGFPSNSSLPVEELIGAPFSFLNQTWESVESVSHVDPRIIARVPAILEVLGWLTGLPGQDRLQTAITNNNEHALGALVQLDKYLGMACDALIERCKRWKLEKEWATLRHEAELAVRLTAAAGQEGERALAFIFLASAYRALGDSQGTIDTYEAAIKAASAARDEHLLAVANDNLGNALADIGRFDEALDCYEEALLHELDPSGLRAIHINRANVLADVGELRLAAQELKEAVKDLELTGTSGRELAVTLDDTAILIARRGEYEDALKMLERARALFESDDLVERAVNALNRSTVYGTLGNKNAAADAFVEAHDCTFEDERRRVDQEHYRKGFLAARASSLPRDDECYRLFMSGLIAKEQGAWQQALNQWKMARQRAWDAGDHAFALRIDANAAALLGDERGQVDQALAIATQVRHEASERGFALPEFMAIGTLGYLAAIGVDIRDRLGPLGAFARTAVLHEVHNHILAEAGLNPEDARAETYDPGTVANELAIQADTHHAHGLAIRYYREAIDKARAVQAWFQLANRLAGLRSVLSRSGFVQDADTVAEELAALLNKDVLPARGTLVVHRALGFHLADRDHAAAINHFRKACTILEGLCQNNEPGVGRADVARQFHGIYRILARLLRATGDDTASFEALQGEKGRRLIDALAALDKRKTRGLDEPPKADEVMSLIDRLDVEAPTFLVDLAVEEDGVTVYLVGNGAVRAIHVAGDPSMLVAFEGGDVLEREARLVQLCLQDSLLCDLARAVTAAAPKRCRLLMVPDQFLYNLPLHATPVNGRPWCDHFSIGYLAAAGALRFAPGKRPTVGRSLVAGDSRNDLPYAASECKEIATILGTKPLVGPDCTRATVEEALREGEFDVIHLAIHGRGDGRRGGRASLLLGDDRGGTEWVAFDELAALPWRAELVVFSGCSTAVAGPRQGNELVGVARAAAERGAVAVIACLWPVGDETAEIFMTAFYKELVPRRAAGPVDLRVVLDEARKVLRTKYDAASTASARRRDGRSLRPKAVGRTERPKVDPVVADALTWAPFILFGDPILGG